MAPPTWSDHSKYPHHEIQRAREAYRIIDRAALSDLLAVSEDDLASAHEEWVRSKLASHDRSREPEWSTAIAVGRRSFVERVQRELGARGRYRRIEEDNGTAVLRETEGVYVPHFAPEMPRLSAEMALHPLWI